MLPLFGLGTFFNGVVAHFNGEKNRELQQNQRDEDRGWQKDRDQTNRDHQESIARENREHQAQLERDRQANADRLAQRQRELQDRIARANQESQERIAAANRASTEGMAAANRAQDWRKHEEVQVLQRELNQVNCAIQLHIAQKHRETTLALPEEQFFWQHWPLNISASTILRSHRTDRQVPLRVIPSFWGFGDLDLETALGQFLQQHYPRESPLRPVELLDGTWKADKPQGGGSIKALFDRLSSEPVLALRSKLGRTDKGQAQFTTAVAYWGIGAVADLDKIIIEGQSWGAMQLDSLKQRIQAWPTERQRYIAAGVATEETVDQDYGEEHLAWNRQMLGEEEKLRAAGLRPRNQSAYRLGDEDKTAPAQVVTVCQCLLAGWFADVHYLVHNNVAPLLPRLLPELTAEVAHLSLIQEAVTQMVEGYRGVFEALKQDRAFLVPDLAVDLALGLVPVQGELAQGMLDYGLACWLALRGADPVLGDSAAALEAARPWVGPVDQGFFEQVQRCYQALQADPALLMQMQGLLDRIEDRKLAVEWARQQELAAAADQHRKMADYFAGGVYHAEQGNYDQAIADFQAAEDCGHPEAGAQRAAVEQRKAEEERRQQLSFALSDKGGTLEFVWVPAGELVMVEGNHRIQVPEFRMGKFPVTQRQYQAVMGNNPSYFTAALIQSEEKKPLGELDPLNRPVEQVTWHQAVEFCTKLTGILQIPGYEVRLPSETMWEWAARGATRSQGYTHAGGNDLNQVGWYKSNANSKTHPVGQLQANELELHDMSGNVWEWCWDHRGDSNVLSKVLPKDGKPLLSGGDSSYRAVRGGSWGNLAGNCSSGNRNYYNPGSSYLNQGFRVVLLPVGFVP
ncbi:formylglycine-generating enzyme family protein [Prochlorothrix hollandica]|uniref:formylglycine-generating enzyme family protein n=1 Tax=Prochlorothrix hollandica TaxID=1223 RepID=UPI0003491213|nr:SUMF1/EgtB/PvdO family nonheme iron enzyme [Prochlorothrix hollandica]